MARWCVFIALLTMPLTVAGQSTKKDSTKAKIGYISTIFFKVGNVNDGFTTVDSLLRNPTLVVYVGYKPEPGITVDSFTVVTSQRIRNKYTGKVENETDSFGIVGSSFSPEVIAKIRQLKSTGIVIITKAFATVDSTRMRISLADRVYRIK